MLQQITNILDCFYADNEVFANGTIIRHSHFCTWPGQFKSSQIVMQQTKFCHLLLELLTPAQYTLLYLTPLYHIYRPRNNYVSACYDHGKDWLTAFKQHKSPEYRHYTTETRKESQLTFHFSHIYFTLSLKTWSITAYFMRGNIYPAPQSSQ